MRIATFAKSIALFLTVPEKVVEIFKVRGRAGIFHSVLIISALVLQILLIPAVESGLGASESDSVAFSEFSGQLYLSRRNMSFSTLPDGNQIRVATLETKETAGAYYSEASYDITRESGEHTLTALGFKGRLFWDNIGTFTGMTNFQIDLLLDLGFEFFQSRFLWDIGFMWNPIPHLLVGPAAGLSYSYFGSTMMLSTSADYDAEIGARDELYLIRDQRTGKSYLPTIGPHNFGGYWGAYLEFTGLGFLELSGALLLRLFDVPLLSNGELNQTLGAEKAVSSVGGAGKLDLFMLDIRATLHLNRLGFEVGVPVFGGYRIMEYPSLGLKEEGLYFGVAFILD